jgi:hypothetical protein
MDAVLELFKHNWAVIGIAAGPLTASMIMRLLFGRNRLMLMIVRGSTAWLAMQVLFGPFLHMAKEKIGYLMEITYR